MTADLTPEDYRIAGELFRRFRKLPIFPFDQEPAPFAGQLQIEAFGSMDFEGWRAYIVIEDRQFVATSTTREGALIGLVEKMAEYVRA